MADDDATATVARMGGYLEVVAGELTEAGFEAEVHRQEARPETAYLVATSRASGREVEIDLLDDGTATVSSIDRLPASPDARQVASRVTTLLTD